MNRLLSAPTTGDPQSPPESPEASTTPEPAEDSIFGRLRSTVEDLLAQADLTELPAGLGMALPHLMPLMLRRLQQLPEDRLRSTLHALAAKLIEIADDAPPVALIAGGRYCPDCGAQVDGAGAWGHDDNCPAAAGDEPAQLVDGYETFEQHLSAAGHTADTDGSCIDCKRELQRSGEG